MIQKKNINEIKCLLENTNCHVNIKYRHNVTSLNVSGELINSNGNCGAGVCQTEKKVRMSVSN